MAKVNCHKHMACTMMSHGDAICTPYSLVQHVLLIQMRERIEESGREPRWEFSRALLFEHTAHMAHVCTDLHRMLAEIASLRLFLGPELRSSAGNDQVLSFNIYVTNSRMIEISPSVLKYWSSLYALCCKLRAKVVSKNHCWLCVQAVDAAIAMVAEMRGRVAGLDWPLFDPQHAQQWAAVRGTFEADRARCLQETQQVIDACFR